uniref:Ig-like domain-containing protein n=1 Tax=Fundulus heteroclitus TaxID=8078 RepID=A0A3Q2QFF5_FUNHE
MVHRGHAAKDTVTQCLPRLFLQVSAVEMLEGESVQLSCDFPTFDVDQPTVLWTRSDLSPSTVYQLQLGGDQLKDQNQLYRGRTSMNTDALETGDLSLNLINLQLSDTGTYTCTVRTSRGEAKVTDIELLVKVLPNFHKFIKLLTRLLL